MGNIIKIKHGSGVPYEHFATSDTERQEGKTYYTKTTASGKDIYTTYSGDFVSGVTYYERQHKLDNFELGYNDSNRLLIRNSGDSCFGYESTYIESIPSNSDLNNYTIRGTYRSSGSTISATLANTPYTSAGFILEVFYTSGSDLQGATNCKQILYPLSADNLIYIRHYLNSSGTWYPWAPFYGGIMPTSTISISNHECFNGFISSSNKSIYFTIPMSRYITNQVNSVSFSVLKGYIRHVNGGYVNGLNSDWNFLDTSSTGIISSVATRINTGGSVFISLAGKDTFKTTSALTTNITNNTPISVYCIYTATFSYTS